MGRLDYTKEESLAFILMDLKCLVFFKKVEREYRHTRIGLAYKDLISSMRKHLLNEVRQHRKEFNEYVDLRHFERTCK